MADIIQWRRDTAANWTSVNPTLAQGEFGYETDTLLGKMGNGVDDWATLPYTSNLAGGIQPGTADGNTLRWEADQSAWVENNALVIADAGNVGIGTAAPAYQLEVADNATTRIANFNCTASIQSFITFQSTDTAADLVRVGAQTGNAVFYTNNTEKMRIDTAGNVGIGRVPKAWSSSWIAAEFGKESSFSGISTSAAANNRTFISTNAYNDGTSQFSDWKRINAAVATQYAHIGDEHVWRTAITGAADSAIAWDESMRIDSAGNVGIGYASPSSKLVVAEGSAGGIELIPLHDTDTNKIVSIARLGAARQIMEMDCSQFTVNNNQQERLRVDASGNLLVGKTTISPATVGATIRGDAAVGEIAAATTGRAPFASYRLDGGGFMMDFFINGVQSGRISTSSGGTPSFVSGSDIALKESVQDMGGELANILALRPVDYTIKVSGEQASGFIAQEVEGVWPHKVTEPNEDGMLGLIDMGDTTARLVKAIQELTARVEELENNG